MYGLTKEDIEKIDNKIKKQLKYCEENNLSPIGANINPKNYFAELNNRVNSITKLAFEQNLEPIFITITLPSIYHPSSKHYQNFTIKQSSRQLTIIWRKLLQSRVLRCSKYHYIKTVEPHKSGVPHLHAVFYICPTLFPRFKQIFENEMKRQNIKRYEFKTEFKSKKYNDKKSSIVAYILKYINKTFKCSKTGKMSKVAYWYVKHNIRRVMTSRTLIPLLIYRKINYQKRFQDMYEATKDYLLGRLRVGENRYEINYLSTDDDFNVIEDNIWTKPNFPLKSKTISLRYKKPIFQKIVPLIIDNEEYKINLLSGNYFKDRNIVYPALLSDYKLLNYYRSLDFEDENISLVHYGITQNEMIKRGLLDMPLQNLNDFNLDFSIVDGKTVNGKI